MCEERSPTRGTWREALQPNAVLGVNYGGGRRVHSAGGAQPSGGGQEEHDDHLIPRRLSIGTLHPSIIDHDVILMSNHGDVNTRALIGFVRASNLYSPAIALQTARCALITDRSSTSGDINLNITATV